MKDELKLRPRASLAAAVPRVPRVFALGATLAVGLIAVGCGVQSDTDPSTSGGASGGPVGGATAERSGDAAGSDESTDTKSESQVPTHPADPASCLHGSWLANNEYFLASMREFGDEPTSVTGEVTLSFNPDGTITSEYRGWRITMLTEGIESVITREGIDEGTFAATESHVDIQETSVGSMLSVAAGGVNMPITPEPAGYSQAQYTCDNADATITTPDGTVILSRIE